MTHNSNTHRAALMIIFAVPLILFATFSIAFAQAGNGQLMNPLSPQFSDIPKFIAGALRILVMVALPIITLFVVYSGFLFVTAQGKPEALNKAKANFMWVLIGALLILGAWIIATLIGGTVTQLTGGM